MIWVTSSQENQVLIPTDHYEDFHRLRVRSHESENVSNFFSISSDCSLVFFALAFAFDRCKRVFKSKFLCKTQNSQHIPGIKAISVLQNVDVDFNGAAVFLSINFRKFS